jgi:hypothetical protein
MCIEIIFYDRRGLFTFILNTGFRDDISLCLVAALVRTPHGFYLLLAFQLCLQLFHSTSANSWPSLTSAMGPRLHAIAHVMLRHVSDVTTGA